ncbi:LA_0442/LA_0875 N-terminal domain-containing protein [Leptospira borgpetersenii]|uniref:LA_0442/LA_0875 N-terminal domain-containing protein n=1 Tax=Leptospira borgpetersenii TaxID=174 RepID=UPI0007740F70|nr:hypothetical protein [Leptospira borgpetersenii]MBE8363947.1 hypothetical protein [Leptospira borgpetersenii serovar Balcanica]MBE8367309.1 hypothetical protein [Leptospira borgpetersenii serovar Balcanica]MBE8401119.1 hypothetical protein [Leptospira borgpetersenii serovar Tarassovi]MBE8402808.1 hypothetical protein [Leptospira borgpetersenii serovar Tarassovi]MBE8406200.1 hypothetical protein [Leptospira borgpetersenii serovar Tarassovi]
MKFFTHSLQNSAWSKILFLFFILLSPSWIFAETILFKSGERAYATVIDQDAETVTIIRDGKRGKLGKSKILKIIFKEIKDEQEIAKIIETEKKKLNKEGKKSDKEEQLDTIYLEQMIKENSYKIVQKRLLLLEKYLEERDGDWENYITAKRNPWEPVWKSAILPGWGHNAMKQSGWGTTYSTLFFVSLLSYFGLDAAEKDRTKAYDKKIEKIIEQQFTTDFLLGSNSSLTSASSPNLNLIFQLNTVKNSNSLNSIRSDEGDYKKAKHTAAAVTIGIYLIQLTHAYFTGKTWAQNNLIQTPTGETVSEGFGIRGNPLVSKEITGGMKSIDIGGQILYTLSY